MPVVLTLEHLTSISRPLLKLYQRKASIFYRLIDADTDRKLFVRPSLIILLLTFWRNENNNFFPADLWRVKSKKIISVLKVYEIKINDKIFCKSLHSNFYQYTINIYWNYSHLITGIFYCSQKAMSSNIINDHLHVFDII